MLLTKAPKAIRFEVEKLQLVLSTVDSGHFFVCLRNVRKANLIKISLEDESEKKKSKRRAGDDTFF